MINDSRISKLLNRVKFTSPTNDKAVQKLFEAQEGGQKYNYVPKSRIGYRPNPDGTESTHLMAREYIPGRGWVVFPTLYQDSNNEWIDMGETHGVNWWPIYEYAQQVGELYDFGEDEEDAINFADKGLWKENMNKRPFFKTRLSPTDELRFQKFYKTLPENLQTDDDLYDIRGYWDAEGKADQFDYSQEKQEDGQYHAYSRHPYTGKILKSPAHPTFQDAMENETHKRVDVYGNIYTGLPQMQDAGTVIDKDGFIDIEKSYGINPLSAEGKSIGNFAGDVVNYMGFEEGGDVSQMGYRDDSPYKDRDFIDIETEEGLIDMSETGKTLLTIDLETGEERVLNPYSGLHKFVGKTIREIPINVEPAESTSVYTYPNVQQSMARMGGQQYQDGGMSFSTLDPNVELVKQRTKRNGDVISIVKRKGPGGEFSRYKIVTRNGEVIKVSEIHGEGGFEDEDYTPYTPDEMYMQQNQVDIRPEPNSQNNRNINNFEINKKK